jgi:SOS response regulatory protein OraA/RecX
MTTVKTTVGVLASKLVRVLNERGFSDDNTGRCVKANTQVWALFSDKVSYDKVLTEAVNTMLPAPLFSVLYDNEMKQYGDYKSFTEILMIDPARKELGDRIELSALEGTVPEDWEWTVKDVAATISSFLKEWKKKKRIQRVRTTTILSAKLEVAELV